MGAPGASLLGTWETTNLDHLSSIPAGGLLDVLPFICPSRKNESVPHSSRLYRDEWAAESRRPVRLDFDHSSYSGGVVVEAAPSILPGQ
jgi:hypothetical protein